MCKIIIKNLNDRKIVTSVKGLMVLKILQDNFIDWMHACGAKGRCTTCKMIVESGADNLSPLTDPEERYMKKGDLKPWERLACQTRIVTGSISITVPDSGKLPHLTYTDK